MRPAITLLGVAILILTSVGAAPPADPAATAPSAAGTPGVSHEAGAAPAYQPHVIWVLPFVAILLSIAFLPLIPATAHWWHQNRHKLIVALAIAAVTCLYYGLRGAGFAHAGHTTEPGWPTVLAMLHHAVLLDYVPFIVLLFSLYTISGGLYLEGDLRARPAVNTAFLGIGAMLASFIGTTGASMVLIRPLLNTNSERRYVKHTVIFFIFLVSNIGGCLLPVGDPPLFLGYLRGVPFLWTLNLTVEWAFMVAILLVLYFLWDSVLYRREGVAQIRLDETRVKPLRLRGLLNLVWLLGVVLAVAILVPGTRPFGGDWVCPPYLRELVQLMFASIAWVTTAPANRAGNKFDFVAIGEVACLFIGIFISMQVPIEILHAIGPTMAEKGLNQPWHFFWLTGVLSSFLDNAPTYVVYFETAISLPAPADVASLTLVSSGRTIPVDMLTAISLGAVFMGANTYIGNGPNFMVKSIAEQAGVPMPSFFGYMLYSVGILIPLFVLVTVIFLL